MELSDPLKHTLKNLSTKPGVYLMKDAEGTVLYVGKAKNLSNRVKSYFSGKPLSTRIQLLVTLIISIETFVVNSETEALILENTYIKKFKPRFNVVFRDDKSYPFIYLSSGKYPRLSFYRGTRKEKGEYFGPFPSTTAVRRSLALLQKVFKVRQCEDSYFRNRNRPCLQYQIDRCSAPCVNKISADDYKEDVQLTRLFLRGKNKRVIDSLQRRMNNAAEQLDYESAAKFRDQIQGLRHLLHKQNISSGAGNMDVMAVLAAHGKFCIYLLNIRNGAVQGNKKFFPKAPEGASADDVMEAFVSFYYLSGAEVPRELVTNSEIDADGAIENALIEKAEHKVAIRYKVIGQRREWLKLAETNALNALQSRQERQQSLNDRFEQLEKALKLDHSLQRLECFDISHTSGKYTVASCVVFDRNGPSKADYRIFNIEDIQESDDFAAMRQVIKRRYERMLKEGAILPDLVIIDGGPGQLKQGVEVFAELGIDQVMLLSIAKGIERKPGMEQLYIAGWSEPLILPSDARSLHLLQHIRDEAHRFAITKQRARRKKDFGQSPLESIPGVGKQRRQQLLTHFGGLQQLEGANVADLEAVPGISSKLAQTIYEYLHDGQ